ncbi:hypothetical protein LEP1GSC016_2145 [Leptospira borgpetersenii serovar Hardjo-bovis str. Sponselee]|uniref:Uncharacterized protein n=2 Tax=Leptospira borgpetersenii TaxID=174 RepID=M6BFB6_LEPBO|nr:hypothetical protein LEP1GSC016_2145 [Leptospira borgpetersenii serovar Hardjo-bovis str. Sponselee]EMO64089.1 hypothetical protein LEP1GSC133_1119 [Leptospira borgpetersenii serovar Pomona str. 200901868]
MILLLLKTKRFSYFDRKRKSHNFSRTSITIFKSVELKIYIMKF